MSDLSRYRYQNIQVHRKNPEYITEFSKTLLDGYYLRENETIPQALARAATAFCHGDYALAQRIYDYAYNGWFMYASPVLSNAPKGQWIPRHEDEGDVGAHYWYRHDFIPHERIQGMPISCFAFNVADSLNGQIDTIQELATLSTSGGGTGAHNSIRATTGKAPGPIPYMKVLDSAIGYFRQGKVRRGALAYYLDVDHPDIIEHIRFRVPGGDAKRRSDNRQQFHCAVNLTDKFIAAVFNDQDYDLVCPHSKKVYDTLPARKIWEDMLETRALTGEPYMMKIDQVNRLMPETQKKLGLKIRGSNLCVAPETLVLTSKGHLPIKSLAGSEVEVWNGQEWSTVTVHKTSDNSKLLKVVTDSGQELECTEYHKFYDRDMVEIRAGDLVAGTVLIDGKKVLSVTDEGRQDETYCFTEPKRHMGVFNGILTGNCSEIILPTDENRTFVCCLSSLNLEKFDEWKDTTIVQDLIRFLDNVLEFFIKNAPEGLAKAKFSAERERALGLGTFGWHSYLQSKMIPLESGGFNSAIQHANIIHSLIQTRALEESRRLAVERGEPLDMIGSGLRNSRLISIAPNANSADLAGTSPSIEPWYRNIFVKDTRAGSFLVKNRYLESLLEEKGHNTKTVWKSIQDMEGSVQHLDFLTEEEKAVFKTAMEIDQHWIVELANERGKYVCQAQSLNLFFPPGSSKEYVNSVHLKFLKSPYVHTLYYFRTERESKVDTAKQIERKALVDWSSQSGECKACQG